MDYEERKKRRFIYSQADSEPGDSRTSEFNLINCVFKNIPQNDQFLFSINEGDDMKGYHIDMRGLKISKLSALVVEDCPPWLRWVLKKTCGAW